MHVEKSKKQRIEGKRLYPGSGEEEGAHNTVTQGRATWKAC